MKRTKQEIERSKRIHQRLMQYYNQDVSLRSVAKARKPKTPKECKKDGAPMTDMPPLPEPIATARPDVLNKDVPLFTDDHMHAYARAYAEMCVAETLALKRTGTAYSAGIDETGYVEPYQFDVYADKSSRKFALIPVSWVSEQNERLDKFYVRPENREKK